MAGAAEDTDRQAATYRLFVAALDLSVDMRERFLDEHCGSDAELRDELAALLAIADADAAAGGLDTSALAGTAPMLEQSLVGHVFGRFRLLDRIGEGGMGVVYRAERTDGIQQVVAVKLIAHEMISSGQERFRRETQLLARLEHPTIARLIDAGVESGRAWIALEFVAGQPIDEYCEAKGLSLRERVRLIADLAGTVAAAHRLLIVHRDIKPTNVLVTAEGVPKLIDFGIAAALEDHGAAHAQTVDIGRLFTPHYAAPEQVSGESITVATDVFGLGALGYRLLTGRTLYPEARGVVGYLLALTQGEVPPPSRAALATLGKRPASQLRGDLDAIFGKALERDPARRYLSAAELQADLQRYLDNKPIAARAPSLRRRVWKFVRRNPVAVGVTATLTVVALMIAAAYAVQLRRAFEAREIAALRGEFLQNMLQSADPRGGGNREVTVASLLDGSLPQIERMVDTAPLVAASMLGLVARTDKGLARYTEGLAASARQLELLRAQGGNDLDLADALELRARLLILSGRDREAEPLLREDLQLVEHQRGATLQLADALEGLANVNAHLGREQEAEALFKREIAVFAADVKDFGARAAFPLAGLASLRSNKGLYAESANYISQALAVEQKYLPPDHPDLLDAEYNYAVSLEQAGRPAQAEPVFRKMLASYSRIVGPDNAQTFEAQQGLAHDLFAQQRFQEAADEALAAAQGLSRTVGDEYVFTQAAWNTYGISTCLTGHGEQGLAALRRVEAVRERRSQSLGWALMSVRVYIGTCLVALHRYAEAEPVLLQAVSVLENDRGTSFDRTQAGYRALRDLYAAIGNAGQAASWQRKLIPAKD
jgi:serine/threonine-protein kinase